MANANTPFGLKPVRGVSSEPFNGGVEEFSTASGDGTAIFIGDPVKLSGTSQLINGSTYADVDQAATGDIIVGVVVGFKAVTADSLIYRAASTVRIAVVNTNPNALFEIQEVNTGTPLTADDIGFNADFVVAAGSTVTGLSGVTLNNVGEATTNTLDLKIIGLLNQADNTIGAAAKWLVRINRHQYANQVAGA